MIRQLHNIHHGATVAIVGSGLSAAAFDPAECEVSIAVNGAAMLAERGIRFNYFMCGSQHSPRQAWFPVDCAQRRIICVRFALHDRILYPDQVYPDLARQSFPFDDIDTIRLPPPVAPHLTYRYSRDPAAAFLTGERPFDKLVIGGTIASLAVQTAYLMGAACIQLYGCAFSKQTSQQAGHYFYPTSADQRGSIDDVQIAQMERTLATVRRNGVRIHIVGETALREYDSLIPIS